ncbi:MAG: hypothetical protein M1822_001069 [Bathelium mastoideum]|nr:MAG: hypothetical protein M1822_001069 [Bathelium mastoideum]
MKDGVYTLDVSLYIQKFVEKGMFAFTPFLLNTKAAGVLPPHADTGYHTNSPSSWKLIESLLDQCVKHHKQCKASFQRDWYPKRLIDVGTYDDESVRLVITEDTAVDGVYLTLSHCWGGANILKLTKESVDSMTKRIKIADLPKTFDDAISITRRLGIKYLWIDSLCIIQDSDLDWTTQSAQMDKVYSNSFCNVAAAGAKDSTQGLWFKRLPEVVRPGGITATWSGLERGQYFLVHRFFWQSLIKNAPLSKRGWVLQERYLAPRVVHFGRRQIAWECLESKACETFPSSVPDYASGNETHSKSAEVKTLVAADLTRLPGAAVTAQSVARWYLVWERIVEAYTRAQLTFSSDKLIVLSGLASRMQQELKYSYMAGLWRPHMPLCLLWECRNNLELSYRLHPYRAPSWSWASIEGEVAFRSASGEPEASFIDGNVDLFDKNLTGNVVGGFVRLHGLLVLVEVALGPASLFDILVVSEVGTETWRALSMDDTYMGSMINWDESEHARKPPADRVFGFPIASEAPVNADPMLYGLVLQSVDRHDRFKRLGCFSVRGAKLAATFSKYTKQDVEII